MLDYVSKPLVKNKSGDLSDENNYIPIAIFCIISKVFENILQRIEDYLWTTDNQFGFKAHQSTQARQTRHNSGGRGGGVAEGQPRFDKGGTQ